MLNPRLIADCVLTRWSPEIGDPTLLGWIVVVAYGAAAAAALAVAIARAPEPRERAFWILVSIAMAALAVNKQLDLQSALTAFGRCAAHAQGWYDQRRGLQVAFIEGVAGIAVILCLGALLLMRAHLARTWPAILGLSFVLAYVTIRAAGFHHVDRLISTEVAGVRANPVLELVGIVLILLNAAALLTERPRVGRSRVKPPRGHGRTRAHRSGGP